MKFRKLVACAAIASVLLTAVGCGGGGTAKTETDSADLAGKTLTVGIWGGNDGESKAIEEIKKKFEEKTGATVDIKVYTDYNTQIQADFIGKTAPDVFYIEAYMLPFYSQLDVLEPLDPEEMQADKYYDNLLNAFKGEDGTLYCIPKDVSTLATYINKDLLESVGVSADDLPTALEDYKPFLVDLQAKLDEEYGKNERAAMTYTPEIARNLYLLESGATIMDADGNATLSDDKVVENVQFIVDMVKAGVWKTPQDLGLGWNGEAFGTEKVAIMEEGNWVYGTLKNDYSNINFEVKEMPTYKGTQHSMSFTVGYGIYVGSSEKTLAKEWIKYAAGEEGMAIWSAGAGCLPSRDDVAKAMDVTSDPVWAVHSKMIEVATPWQRGTTMDIINNAYKNFLPTATSQESSAKEAMEKVDKQANSEIANAK